MRNGARTERARRRSMENPLPSPKSGRFRDDRPVGAQPPQSPRHCGWRAADLLGEPISSLHVVGLQTGQKPDVEQIELVRQGAETSDARIWQVAADV